MRKLEKLAFERGKPLDWIIPPLANKLGVTGAAKELGLAPSTISKWLKDNNYICRPMWMEKATRKEVASIDRLVAEHNAWLEEQGEKA